MAKLAFIADLHLADFPPGRRRSGYREIIINKLKRSIDFVNELNLNEPVLGLAIGGDIFHIKRASSNSHLLVNLLWDTLDKCEVPLYLTVGNHDVEGNNTSTGFMRTPLSTIIKHENVYIPIKPIDIWNGWHIATIPADKSEDPEFIVKWLKTLPSKSIAMLHISIVNPDQQEFEGMIRPELIAGHVPFILMGDIHEPASPYNINGTIFCNPGSVARTSTLQATRSFFNMVLIDVEELETGDPSLVVQYVPFDIETPEEAFNDLSRLSTKAIDSGRFTELTSQIAVFDEKSLQRHLDESFLTDQQKALAIQYVFDS